MRSWARLIALLLLGPLLFGCAFRGNPNAPIPRILHPAPVAAVSPAPLVVVLPGRYDSVDGLDASGIAAAIQASWPQADVMLTGAGMAYYMAGQLQQRLHDDIIAPARARGVGEIWLVGASLGGMGAVLYDRAHPGEVDGIVLLAPYLGESSILSEIALAGGAMAWQPGPEEAMTRQNWQREMWRFLRSYGGRPELASRVWLAYGDSDRLREAVPVIAPVLRPEQILEREGGHVWGVWTPAAGEVFARVQAARVDGLVGRE
jgi:pimeloyl-ACP methyl ester carboxylesterase